MRVVPLETGAVFADKYRIDGVLGKGGMGVVYAATNLAVGRRVAIKVMEAGDADPDTRHDLLRRFKLEAQAAAVIDHPGIVDVLDMGETEDGSPYIVMEFLEGATLKAVLKQMKALTVAQAVAVMAPVLEALKAAHAAGVVHRDIKPANIFLCTKPRRVIKVLDFGISRFGEGSGVTQTGVSMGTPQYMSPEQVRGERGVGAESDLYSVGAVLFALLAGKPPFSSEGGEMATLARVLSEPPPALAEVKPGLPPSVCELVDGLLVKDRAQRAHDADEVRRALLELAEPDAEPVWAAAQVAVKTELSKGTPRPASGSNSKRSAPGVLAMAGKTPSRPTVVSRPQPRHTVEVEPPKPSRGLVSVAAVVAGVLVLAAGAAFALWPKPPPPPPPPVVPDAVALPLKVVPDDAPAPAAPADVDVTLSADPKETRFVVDGDTLDCNPCTLKRAPGTKLTVKAQAEKFVASELEVLFDKPHETHVALAPVAAPTTPGKKPGKKPTSLTVDEANPYK